MEKQDLISVDLSSLVIVLSSLQARIENKSQLINLETQKRACEFIQGYLTDYKKKRNGITVDKQTISTALSSLQARIENKSPLENLEAQKIACDQIQLAIDKYIRDRDLKRTIQF